MKDSRRDTLDGDSNTRAVPDAWCERSIKLGEKLISAPNVGNISGDEIFSRTGRDADIGESEFNVTTAIGQGGRTDHGVSPIARSIAVFVAHERHITQIVDRNTADIAKEGAESREIDALTTASKCKCQQWYRGGCSRLFQTVLGFSGAVRAKAGLFEAAAGGTVDTAGPFVSNCRRPL